ncbi:alpha/beta hydrolase [Glutamicibacter sp.]|uniref:alpha/beta fold hydrolase n=1 Tax=Glutamicibacter sp. TaxID=1931995 RepID=UPI0028BD5954|nr:alpha/beta hydrolase [Glutamicibacter sp.]
MSEQHEQPVSAKEELAREATEYPEVHPARGDAQAREKAQTLVFLHGGNVGNWSWDPQVLAFADFNILTLHLPAFGARYEEQWEGLDSAADDVAALIADEVSSGGVHLVGMSLGGVIALHVAARHPELVDSVMITGTPVTSMSSTAKAMQRMQLKLIGSEWYWRFQAGAYGMVDDERELFAEHGVKLKAQNMRAIMDEIGPGALPAKLSNYTGPVLILAGSKEPKLVAKSFAALSVALPQAKLRLVPGMHHQWNIENPLLFNSVLRRWITDGGLHQSLVRPANEKSHGAASYSTGADRMGTPEEVDPEESSTAKAKAARLVDRLDPRKLDLNKLDLKAPLSKKPPVDKRPSSAGEGAEEAEAAAQPPQDPEEQQK